MTLRNRCIACILLCFMVFALGGCNADGFSYLALQERLLKLSSYHQSGSLRFELDAQLPSELEENMKPHYLPSILNAIDDIKLDYDVRYCDGESKNRFCVSTDHTSFDVNTYLTENGNFISEIPTVTKAFLPKEYTNAEYVVFNMNEYFPQTFLAQSPAEETNGITINRAIMLSRDIFAFMKSYLPKAGTLPEIVKKNGNTYLIQVTDKDVKAILRALTDSYLTNEEARQDVKDLYDILMEFYSEVYGAEFAELVNENTDCFFAMDNFTEAKKLVDAFFDDIEDLPLLGEDGIVIKTVMGKNGYPENVDTMIDLRIDVNKIEEYTIGEATYSEPFVISAKLYSQATLSEINKIKQLDIPKVDDEKVISLACWIEKMTSQEDLWEVGVIDDPDYIDNVELPAADGSITVFCEDWKCNFESAKPKMLKNTLYVPISFFTENGGIGYEVGNDVIFLYQYGNCYYAPIGSSVWETDSYSVDVKQPIAEIDGEIYLPLRAIWEVVVSGSVHWDASTNSVKVYGY